MKKTTKKSGWKMKEHKPWKGPTKFKTKKPQVWKKPPPKEETTY
jgi:hypothetical protein